MPIWKIAAGVFIGNLLFGLLAWAFVAMVWAGAKQDADVARANQAYSDMLARQAAEKSAH